MHFPEVVNFKIWFSRLVLFLVSQKTGRKSSWQLGTLHWIFCTCSCVCVNVYFAPLYLIISIQFVFYSVSLSLLVNKVYWKFWFAHCNYSVKEISSLGCFLYHLIFISLSRINSILETSVHFKEFLKKWLKCSA